MTRALAEMLTRAIDYAGVFPPAKLELASAFDNYSRYRQGPEAWILNRFAVRAAQLAPLGGLIVAAAPPMPVEVAVIGSGGTDRASWESGLEADARALNAFESAVGELGEVVAYETRPPDNREVEAWLRDLCGFGDAEVFVELGWDDAQVDALAAAAAEFVGVKARAGGETASAFPPPDRLAAFVQGALQLGLRFKLTAGLHRAFPHLDAELGVRRYGFVPLFAATAIAKVHDLSVREIAELLELSDPAAFRFGDAGLTVHNWSVGLSDLVDAREDLAGFGSCSVEEPLETLKLTGLD